MVRGPMLPGGRQAGRRHARVGEEHQDGQLHDLVARHPGPLHLGGEEGFDLLAELAAPQNQVFQHGGHDFAGGTFEEHQLGVLIPARNRRQARIGASS